MPKPSPSIPKGTGITPRLTTLTRSPSEVYNGPPATEGVPRGSTTANPKTTRKVPARPTTTRTSRRQSYSGSDASRVDATDVAVSTAAGTSAAASPTSPPAPIPSAVLLSHPTALASGNISEQQYPIALPFDARLYSTTAPAVLVTSNGLLTVTDARFSWTGYVDASQALYTGSVPPGTAFPWWHYMQGTGADHGIFYQIDAPNLLSVEWLLVDTAGKATHFLASYSSYADGHVNFYYVTDGDGGTNSTIGVQGLDTQNSKPLPFPGITI